MHDDVVGIYTSCMISTIAYKIVIMLMTTTRLGGACPLGKTPPHSRVSSIGSQQCQLLTKTQFSRSSGSGRRISPGVTGRRDRVKVQGYNSGSPGVPERVVGALPYLLPLFDGLRYGKFLFLQFPIFANVIAPLNPLIQLYFSVPFAGLASFFAVYILIINNYEWPRNVRFNAMQAVLLDIILILPGLIESVLKIRPMGGLGLQLYIQLYNAIFLFIFAAVVYGVVSSMIGQTARIPLVADAADAQVR